MEDKALFNEYYYGEIDSLVKTMNEGLEKTLTGLDKTVELNDLYRAISYSTMTYLNAVFGEDESEEMRQIVTAKADSYIKDFMQTDDKLTYRELYILPLLMMDIAAFTMFVAVKEREQSVDEQ